MLEEELGISAAVIDNRTSPSMRENPKLLRVAVRPTIVVRYQATSASYSGGVLISLVMVGAYEAVGLASINTPKEFVVDKPAYDKLLGQRRHE